ncbi:CYTH domain-containing protein [Palleronia abyssalis]|uniref:CYTH domain-containing protein n=1 Tax=Palleronia abyssalis TaxID=1501240 RepID=UPI000D55E27E|nr:CYTH domain-containing protein [Palleronia abyssalis]
MAEEIERKFLVTGEGWRDRVSQRRAIRQFYLAQSDSATVRVRISDGTSARLTVKGRRAGMSRPEYEWDIPVDEAREMEALAAGRVLVKTRHLVRAGDLTWEVDAFEDGLTLAEIELPFEDTPFDRPDWLGREVTDDPSYYNAAMALGGDQASSREVDQ